MAFRAVLDTCTLYPAHLRDTLLRLAERHLYVALWSEGILGELRSSLTRAGVAPSSVERLIAEMRRAFPDSGVEGYEALIDAMECDPKDKHVLAAAVRSDAAALVTFNVSDFPSESTEQYAIEVVEPDEFLLDLLDLNPQAVIIELETQAATNRASPKTLSELLRALAVAGVPKFASQVEKSNPASQSGLSAS
ncbi:MAG: PIN domain-containing protein [Acidimicrobiaceae bacterium]|nr:PIN domain-containing protein [Acidimicrobiaceae bacterium]